MAWAASTIPRFTSRMEFSNSRVRYGVMNTISGIRAAVVPIRVPTMVLVSGMMNTIRMMKGTLRMMLMMVFSTR